MNNLFSNEPVTVSNIGRAIPVKQSKTTSILPKDIRKSNLSQQSKNNMADEEKYDVIAPKIFTPAVLNVPPVKQVYQPSNRPELPFKPASMRDLFESQAPPVVGSLRTSSIDNFLTPESREKLIRQKLDASGNPVSQLINTKLPESRSQFLKPIINESFYKSGDKVMFDTGDKIYVSTFKDTSLPAKVEPRFNSSANLNNYNFKNSPSLDFEIMYGSNVSDQPEVFKPEENEKKEEKTKSLFGVPKPLSFYNEEIKKTSNDLVLPTFNILDGIKLPPLSDDKPVLKSEKDVIEFTARLKQATDVDQIRTLLENVDITNLNSNLKTYTDSTYNDIVVMPELITSEESIKDKIFNKIVDIPDNLMKKVKEIYKYITAKDTECIVLNPEGKMEDIIKKVQSNVIMYPDRINIPVPLLFDVVMDSRIIMSETPSNTYTNNGVLYNLKGEHPKTKHKDCCSCVREENKVCKEFSCVNCDDKIQIFSDNLIAYSSSFLNGKKKVGREEREDTLIKRVNVRIVGDFATVYYTHSYPALTDNDIGRLAIGFAIMFVLLPYGFDGNYKKTVLLLDLYYNTYMKNKDKPNYTIADNTLKVLPVVYAVYESNDVNLITGKMASIEVTHDPTK